MDSGLLRSWLVVMLATLAAAGLAAAGQAYAEPSDSRGGLASEGPPENVEELQERTRAGEQVRVIVKVDPRRQQEVASQARGAGAEVIREFHRFPYVVLRVGAPALQALIQAPGVRAVSEDVPEPPALDNSLPVIGADTVHDLGWTGEGFSVAVLDTGIDNTHPFFEDRVVAEACFSSDDDSSDTLCPDGETEQTGEGAAQIDIEACTDESGNNLCDHGPHVAGIAAGHNDSPWLLEPTAGVAPDVGIIGIQVFTRFDDADDCEPFSAPCVRTFPGDQLAGLEHILDLAEDGDHDIAAANMSLGGGENTEPCDKIERAVAVNELREENIATVAAAGNDGLGDAVSTPACISTAVAVGATNNNDDVAGLSNRGELLDLFAPGIGITSAVDDDDFGSKDGTSMSAPHVAGAWAVIRQAFPDHDVGEVLEALRATGVDITYDSGPGDDSGEWDEQVTTPRIDLLAALQSLVDEPELTAEDAVLTVDEGAVAENSGTYTDHTTGDSDLELEASVGEVTDEGEGEWSWTFETVDGPRDSQEVTITATDNLGQEAEVSFDLTVDNVAPSVEIDEDQAGDIAEGDTLSVQATFTDPGINDAPFTVTITCYDVTVNGDQYSLEVDGTDVITEFDHDEPLVHGTATGQCPYGDTSEAEPGDEQAFTGTVEVTDRDGGTGSAEFEVVVTNVDPTVEIDTSEATDIHGTPTLLTQIGKDLELSAGVTDPGSDDLFLTWDWGDGTDSEADYFLIDADNPDPFPSPTLDPRDVTDTQANAWEDACHNTVVVTATDDDAGQDSDEVDVLIVGDADVARSAGYWQVTYHPSGRQGSGDFDEDTRECYLTIIDHMSLVFDDDVDAHQVLHPRNSGGNIVRQIDRQLLAAWLNFANGAVALDDEVDTTGDGQTDTTFGEAVASAEDARLDDDATPAELEAHKDGLETINTMDEE